MTTRTKEIIWIAACLSGGIITLIVSIPWTGINNPLFAWFDNTHYPAIHQSVIAGIPDQHPNPCDTIHSLIHISPPANREAFIAWATESLKKDAEKALDLRSLHSSLFTLRHYLYDHYPDEWPVIFSEIIYGSLPEKTSAVYDLLARMDRYNQWFELNKRSLAPLDYAEIKAIIQARQHKIFGRYEGDTRGNMVSEVLEILSESYETSIDKKLSLFIQLLKDTDGCPTGTVLDKSKFYLSRAFFRMPSVQKNLKSLNDMERRQAINVVRQALGYSEEDLEKLAQVDERRNERWLKGNRYMKERTSLTASYQGVELEQRLYALQKKYFADMAQTIRTEEASGFFRFQRQRMYGSN